MTSRVTTTTVGDYNQVIAVTQWLINQAFDNAWVGAHQNGSLSQDITRRDGSSITGLVLGAPKVLIDPQVGNHSLINYVITIQSGTLKLFMSADPKDNSTISYQMDNWSIVFPVNIGLVGVNNAAKIDEIRQKIDKPGDYTIQTLLVDMQTAQFVAYDATLSNFGVWSSTDTATNAKGQKITPPGYALGQTRNWSQQPTNVQNTFRDFLNDMADMLSSAELCDMGYTASSTSVPSGTDPTFIPSDVRFQTYPWTDPTTKQQPKGSLAVPGALNYLLYLEMTDKNAPPDPNSTAAFLSPGNGNWTDGRDPSNDDPSTFGSMVISGKNFLDKYFLPKLWKVNRTLVTSITSVTPYIHQIVRPFTYEYCFNYSFNVGTGVPDIHQPQPDDNQFAFVKATPADAGLAAKFAALPANSLVWYYQAPASSKDGDDDSGTAGSKSYMNCDGNASTVTRLSIVPGSNQIVFSSVATLHLHWEVNPSRVDPNFGKTMDVTTKTDITFTMTGVSDGGLIIAIDVQGGDPSITGDIWDSGDSDRVKWPFQQARTNLNFLVAEINDALKGQERFYFPSKGTFFIKDAIFNHEGDLITGLEYNGNDSSTPNPTAETRAKASVDLSKISYVPLQPQKTNNTNVRG